MESVYYLGKNIVLSFEMYQDRRVCQHLGSQLLGLGARLGVTKAFALHHILALRKQGPRPRRTLPAPPGTSSVTELDTVSALEPAQTQLLF